MDNQTRDNAPWTYEPLTRTILDKDGNYVAMIRGWGNLTGRGALELSNEDAVKIQDDRGQRLAKVPEYEAEIIRKAERIAYLKERIKSMEETCRREAIGLWP